MCPHRKLKSRGIRITYFVVALFLAGVIYRYIIVFVEVKVYAHYRKKRPAAVFVAAPPERALGVVCIM